MGRIDEELLDKEAENQLKSECTQEVFGEMGKPGIASLRTLRKHATVASLLAEVIRESE